MYVTCADITPTNHQYFNRMFHEINQPTSDKGVPP